ncbi:TPA_asm: BapA prefix-like domain-containing protein [Salmonella enterica subsp. enterica serovar Typhi str. CT18]|uniref:BapA prefix-like domain-containing protein n=1 Tax=Salmonella enterica subsp. enterica serovar Typhi str. CT18 TaxID=220341 RepID=A0A714V738_SALTI|nr:BapA prefix-like domain-containing protein [Salmonella enterica subsp. enterica serovar Typhi]HAB6947624.1 BapA prefix-like domain-containing protein [Salmonella enterica subsp. enterica serovar Typhi str. CT18]EEH4585947.1 BapA prefix-like domain-containing protein [Salmonella enterica subsp. enterica serovar Typhi]HAD4400704.1 BapA prefix-like domain-containing protein [Salmonella enterica subsp. enterica serovar Typhi str. CT18]HAD5480200.1 BapA prefix-like domain-containing protein [Salm
MRLLAVVSKLTGVSTTVESSAVTLNAPSIVKLSVARDEISQLTRINQDLVVRLHSGETITIKNFYVTNDLGASQLVLAENDGTLWWVENPQAGLHFEQIADINELLVTSGASHEAGGAVWPWVLAGAVAAGGIAAIASSGGGDSHHHSDGDNPPPDNTNPDGNPPDNSNPGGSNPNGNTPGSSNPVDTTPPLAPGELLISADGKTVSGEAEAGSLITIKDPSGNVVGEGKADSDGKFSIDLTAPQISGEQLTVTATDDAGNTGPSATIDAPNIPLPDTPVITAAIDDAAPLTGTLSNNQFTNDNTPTLEGTGSAGTVIHIYANGQEIGSTTVDTSGNWHFAITSALADGENHFTAIATNVKGESSESARFTLTIDTLSPDAPRVELMADNTGLLTGPLQNNDRTDEAKPLFSGQGEAGNTITIKEGSTVIGSATVDENGRWTFTPTTPLSDGEHTFTVEQSDKAGNASRVTTTPTIIVDTTPPDAAIIDNVAKDGTTVSGTAEAGSTVSIYDPAGNYLGSTITGENNHFSITLNPAQTHGERLEARIQDAVGNIGPATEFTASDSQYPAQPTILTVTDDAGAVTGLLKNGDATDDNRPTLSGTAEPGSTISINDNGFPVPSFPPIVADADGKWSFTPSLALADGDHVFTATATNDRGTSGQSVAFTIDIDTQPPVLEGLAVSDVGDRLTGTTEAGSTVVIKDSLGNTLGSGTAGDDGTFSIGISPAKINGETLSISVTDKAANSGPVETLNAPDKTAPAAPNGLIVATDGLSVSGQAEAGATVTIRDSSNTVLGSAVANGNGQFIVPLNAAQTNGQALIATATDIANNESAAATVDAPDSTAPEMPKNVVISEDGASISGTAEPGSSITITTPDGTPLGSGKADGEGHFTLPLAPAQTNGEQVTVTATDSANNVSPPTTAQAPDITAPDKPIITQVLDDVESFTGPLVNGQTTNDNRPTLSGTAEAGARVEIFDNGVSLGLATLQPNGGWTFTPSQNLGEGAHRLTVIATDAKGNASPAGNESPESISFTLRIDTQAPDAPQIVSAAITGGEGEVLLANGSITNQRMPTLSGTGEPGAIITLYNNGVELATVQVNPQGSWTYPLTRNLSEGLNILTATATDAAGNSSPTSGVFSVTLDTQPPAQPDAPLISDNVAPVIGNIGNNGATNDTTPTFSGTGEIGSTIILYNNGSEIGRTTVGDNGSWNFTPAALTPETYTITVTETDIAGNISPPSASVTFTLDTTAPANPVITFAEDNVGEVQDTIVSGATTDDNTPVIHGTGDIGSVITLYNGSSVVGVVTVDETGTWTLPVTSALPDGVYTLTAIAADAAGNSSGVSNSFTFTVDTVPLQPPVVNEILDDVAPVTGPLTDGAFTNDRTLTINGSGENGSTVTIYDNGVAIGTALVTDGVWTFNTSELSEASHALTFSATDDAGNTTAQTQPITITVDITAPPAPTIQTVADDGTRVAGLADPYATVEIHHADGTLVGSAVANGTGEFVVTLSPAQTDGGTLTAIAIDRAGNNGPATNFPASDSGLPAVPAITAIEDDVGSIQGNIAAGGATDDTMPTLRGTTDIGSTVEVFIDGDSAGFATVDASGNWIFEIATPLSESTHYFTVQATNANGPGGLSAPVGITVDLSAPAQPVITSATDDVPGMTGTLDNGALTNDSRPTLNGTGEAGATIRILDNGVEIGSATVDQSGNWRFTPNTPLESNAHIFTAVATDPAGNSGQLSDGFTLNIDAQAPDVPVITSVIDDNNQPTVPVLPGQSTDDRQPILNGTGEPGATITIFDNGTPLGTAQVGENGSWTFPVPRNLSEGSHNLTVSATDPAGNTSAVSAPWTIVVDITPPAIPVLTSVVDDQPGITGNLVSGQLTNDATLTLNGRGEAGATINVYLDGNPASIGTTTVNSDGTWSFTPQTPLANGSHTFTLSATDPAGNSSAVSSGFVLTIDTTPPAAPVIASVADNTAPVTGIVPNGGSTNETRPTLSGTGEAGTTISIYNGSALVGTAQVQANGSWSFTPSTSLGAGVWNLTATATDAAGNTSAASEIRSFTIDTTAPAAPVIDTVYDGTGPITGNLSSGQITDEARPVISGTREANTTIRLYDNGTLLAEIPADNSSSWRYTPDASLATGNHVITVIAVDAAGNASPVSDSVNFVVDTTPPLTPVITSVSDDQAPGLGTIANGQNTNDPTPTFSGTAEAGATITLYENGTVIGTTTAQPDGAWSVSTSTLASGTHVITAVATDAAGNSSPNSTAFTLTVDTTAPQTPILTSVVDDVAGGVTGNLANGQITNDNRPTLNGTAEAGSVVSIYDGDTLLGVTSANASGAWSFTPTTGLNDGTRTLTVTATDPAGNVSPATSGFTIVVDTLAPTVPLITSIVDDVPNNTGAIGNGQSTNDTQPTLNGTAEANSAVSIFDNGALVATVNANASGNWSWTPTASLGQGSHAYSVSAADAAGNVSAASPSTTIIVDTIAPGAPGNLVINATGNRVTGTAEAGSTVTITSETGVVLGTATADGTGSFTATLTPAQTNGQPLLAFAQDKAGNTGIAAGFTAPDTRVPEAPIITNVVDDVGIYTGAIANGPVTNDAQPTLNGTAQAGATVSIYNNGALLGTTTANASGNWSFTPTGNLTEGSHAFTATATNANGTGSVSTAATVIVDTLAPGTPSGTLSADGGSLSGQAEANSTVTVTLAGGVTLTTTAGSNGAWSLTLPTKQIEGQLINVTATDAAGNASGTLGITAPILPLAARDNITSLDLTSTAVTSTQNYSDYGLLLVGALGNVASVLGNDTAQVEFTIAEGGTGDVTIDAAATGIVLSLLSTQEIVVQRYDTSLGTWTTIVNTAVGDFANLLTLTGSGVTLNLNGLGEGQYRVLTYNTSLLATGSYTSLDVDVHQTSAGIISGPTISTGNVMADDTAPTGTTVTAITNANGVSTPVGAGGVDILGQYGTLHINQDGSYTYTLTKPTAGYGHKESFTYTITQNGVGSSAAQLVINLGPAPVPGSVIATDNNASLVFDTHVSYVNNGPSTQSGVTVLSVGLGNVLNANLLDDMTNPIIFNVEEGATRTMTLQGTVGGVSLVSTFDLYVYRFNDAIQQYEQFRVQKGWINTLLLAGQSQPLTLTLPGGEYLFVLNTASGISVLTGYTLAISQDHTYAVDSITANTTGNVLTNDVAPTDALLTEVNGVAIAATGTTEVNGLYGSLIIDARGNYTYTLKNGVGADSIKTPDSFIYTLKAPNGDTDTASLNITPTARALDAINDVSDTLSVATLQDTAAWLDSSVGSASWGLLGKSGSGSGTFDVATGTVLKGASLVFDVSTLITLGNLNISWAIQENGTVIRNGTVPVANITLGSATVTVNLSGLELDAGTYTLNFTGTNTLAGAATITPRVIGTTVDLDNFETSGTHTVLGNIFDGSDAAGAMDQLNTVNTRLSISGYNGSAATLDAAANTTSATIQGHYGTLQINLDGAYTYTLNNGVAMSSITSKEVFTYQLDDKIGHTDSATLTIDMAPQIVSTNQNDVLIGSAYGDTLIYHLLNGADATGGNGADRWQNFSTAQGDKIDIHELLTGWDHQAATLGNFVQVHTSGANTVISVDRDGAGSAFKSTDLVTLENVQLTLNDLLQNNHLITGG